MLVAYLSGHGFGHATRCGEVLRELRERRPELPLTLVSAVPEALLRAAVPGGFVFESQTCDVGVAQRGALELDLPATAAAWRRFAAGWEALVERERRRLVACGARLVLGDVPPLAFAAAARAGVPSAALANFSWDWIYAHLSRHEPALKGAAEASARAYAECGLLLRLPFSAGLEVFRRQESLPAVARRARRTRDETRRRLGWEASGPPRVLWSFGGFGLPGFDPGRLGRLRGYRFTLASAPPEALPDNVECVDAARLEQLELGYADLVAASDAIVSKPGYGIVTDAAAAGTPLVYTERGDFPEYACLVAELPRYLACAWIDNQRLLAGDLEAALEAALGAPRPLPPPLDGAARAAERLLAAWDAGRL